jgi:alcohol dehydrogenase YqhD (iron-dependent ADH family)
MEMKDGADCGAVYEALGLPSQQTAYGLGQEAIESVVNKLENKHIHYGEHANISPAVAQQVLERSL